MKFGTIQALASVGLGTMLGFLAATRDFGPSVRADEASPPPLKAEAAIGATAQDGVQPSCCPQGAARDLLLARADPGPPAAQVPAAPASSSKKPNILVIMGDDVGIWNIGAYHRGMMAGRT